MNLFIVIGFLLLNSLNSSILLKKEDIRQKQVQEIIAETKYKIFTDTPLILKYEQYPYTYGMHLVREDKYGVEQEYMDDYQNIANQDSTSLRQGCTAFQRQIQFDDIMTLKMQSDEKRVFTDVVVIQSMNKSFSVRNDFKLAEVFIYDDYLTRPNSLQEFGSLLGETAVQNDVFNNHPYLFYDQLSQNIFVITQFGVLSFDSRLNLEDLQFTSQKQFKPRLAIYDVHYDYNRKLIFIALGQEGIDIYRIIDGHLFFLQNIDNNLFLLAGIDILDVSMSADQKILYALDSRTGLHLFNILDLDKITKHKFHLAITHAIAFDHIQQTFIFIATSIHNQDYAVEAFVDIEQDQYYFNRFYLNELQLLDVVVHDNYALLIGQEAHKIIFHSIHNGYINQFLEHQTSFTASDLIKVVEIEKNITGHIDTYFGLGKSQFKKFSIKFSHPQVKCISSVIGDTNYTLTMNASRCITMDLLQLNSQFSQCQIQQKFTLAVKKPILLTSSKLWIGVLIIFIIIMISCLSWILWFFWQKWKHNIQFLSNQIVQLKKQSNYEEQHNVQLASLDASLTQQQSGQSADVENTQ